MTDSIEHRGSAVFVGFVLLGLLTLMPFALVTVPPILDYPNHLARMQILSVVANSTNLSQYYALSWSPIPNLALDIIVPLMARWMSVEFAFRTTCGLILLAMSGGCVVLHRVAHGRWSLWPLTSFLVLYNRMLLWGFLNYLAGVALVLWALAFWLALRSRPRLRLIVGILSATVIYGAHLAAFGCYALSALALAATEDNGMSSARDRVGSLVRCGITFLPALGLFAYSHTASAPQGVGYGNILRKFDLPIAIFDNYNRFFDGATFAIVVIAIFVGLRARSLVLDKRLRWSLLALGVGFVIIPSRFLGAAGIDHRLPVFIALLFVAAADWAMMRGPSRLITGVALAALFAVRLAVTTDVWLRADREYSELRAGLQAINPGDSVAVAAPIRAVQAGGIPLLHFPCLAVLDRDAFVSTVFADPTQQPIRLTGRAAKLAQETVPASLWKTLADGGRPDLPGYDVVVVVDPQGAVNANVEWGHTQFMSPRMIVIRLNQSKAAASEQ